MARRAFGLVIAENKRFEGVIAFATGVFVEWHSQLRLRSATFDGLGRSAQNLTVAVHQAIPGLNAQAAIDSLIATRESVIHGMEKFVQHKPMAKDSLQL